MSEIQTIRAGKYNSPLGRDHTPIKKEAQPNAKEKKALISKLE